MDDQRLEKLMAVLTELQDDVHKDAARKLEINKCERIIRRLVSFSPECEECEQHLVEFEEHFLQHKEVLVNLEKSHGKQHRYKITSIISHLQKKHKLVTSGYYVSIYMLLFMGVGLIFGQLLFDNLALGLPIGMAIGIAIGSGLDADAKKKGLVI